MKDFVSKEGLKFIGKVTIGCLVALAVHQMFIAPRISKKANS